MAFTGLLLFFCDDIGVHIPATFSDKVLSMLKTCLRANRAWVHFCGHVRVRSVWNTARCVLSDGNCEQQKLSPVTCPQSLPGKVWRGVYRVIGEPKTSSWTRYIFIKASHAEQIISRDKPLLTTWTAWCHLFHMMTSSNGNIFRVYLPFVRGIHRHR